VENRPNWYLLVAGALALALIGGLAHSILGETRIISLFDPESLGSAHHTGETVKIYLRWFWHVGTLNVFLFSLVGLVIGLKRGLIPSEKTVIKLLSVIFFGMFLAFFTSAISSPAHFLQIPQGGGMLFGSILFWVGGNKL